MKHHPVASGQPGPLARDHDIDNTATDRDVSVPLMGLTSRYGFQVEQLAHAFDQRFDFERLVHEIVRAGGFEVFDFVFFDHPGNADDPHRIHGAVATHSLANFL